MTCNAINSKISHAISNYLTPDKTFPKVMSLIPIIGMLIEDTFREPIVKDLKESLKSEDTQKVINSYQLLNEYNLCSTGRNIFSLAIVVTITALGILTPFFGIVLAAYFGYNVFYDIAHIYSVQKAIEATETNLDLGQEKPLNTVD